ncbi:toxin-antitoxin system HicB family antitoxin [Undibacterium curvum]|uniref:Toxin-antitoxin system HicB family antitoxin n=1 Tax=Undibacterium curvum TaxID=2762294 RepID=A0ABR7A5S3_9BURK|nr:toxin-antitoxin system HicB family antitoxin [Undibacterium curvum]MBC3932237.1 toxin-antitoxin system HicB family antitoxin [Undibacterium curvum]
MASPGKKSFPLRIDPALWIEIERLAAQELRSANAQVEYMLRQSLQQRGLARSKPLAQSRQADVTDAADADLADKADKKS